MKENPVETPQLFDLRPLRLKPGDVRHERWPVEFPTLTLAGQPFTVEPNPIEVRLEIQRTNDGLYLKLAFEAELTGPCYRCLEPARLPRQGAGERVPREPPAGRRPPGQRLRRPRPGRRHGVGAGRAGHRHPGEDPVPSRLRRLVSRTAASGWSRESTMTAAPRSSIPAGTRCGSCYNFGAHGSPQEENIQGPSRQAARHALDPGADAQRVSAVPPSGASAPPLPQLRPLPGA